MYRPNFCGECGEQIGGERRKRWPWVDHRFCRPCRQRLGGKSRASRWLSWALVFGVALTIAYRAGRFSARPPPLVIQRVAAAPSSPPPSDQPTAGGNAAARVGSTKDESPTAACGARTKKGKPCSRRVAAAGDRCWQHAGKSAMRSR